MIDFEYFINKNKLKKKDVAEFLSVSAAFITQLVQGIRDVPEDKLALIKANKGWDTSMLKDAHSTGEGEMLKENTLTAKKSPTQLDLDFSAIIDSNMKMADAVQMIARSNAIAMESSARLAQANEALASMLKEALMNGKDADKKIDAISERIEGFLSSSRQKHAPDVL